MGRKATERERHEIMDELCEQSHRIMTATDKRDKRTKYAVNPERNKSRYVETLIDN